MSLLQYLASQTAKLDQLELLLNHGYVRNESFGPKIMPPKVGPILFDIIFLTQHSFDEILVFFVLGLKL